MVTTRSYFNEKLQWILSGEHLDEQVYRARAVAQMDPTFPQLIRMACIDDERLHGLPDGMPNTIKLDDLPDGISDTTIRQELRRIKNFMKFGINQTLEQTKREAIWIQILEGVHPHEAKVLTEIKDRTLFYTYPALFDIMEALTGVPVDIPRDPKSPAPPLQIPDLVTESTVETSQPDGPVVTTDGEATEPVSPPPTPKKRGKKKVESDTSLDG